MTPQLSRLDLFGGERPWDPSDWTSSDDRVRGGASQSYFKCDPSNPVAVFDGNLDIKTLGGAGFASQRTTGEQRHWDFSTFDGLLLDIAQSDGKQYTLILKDELLPKSADGREQSTISWEHDFVVEQGSGHSAVYTKWSDLKATYRGREKKDAEPLDLTNIKRISLMMRSFFGAQEGDFSLSVISIGVYKGDQRPEGFGTPSAGGTNSKLAPNYTAEKTNATSNSSKDGYFSGLMKSCIVL